MPEIPGGVVFNLASFIDLIKSLDKKSDAKHMNFTKTNIQDYTPKD